MPEPFLRLETQLAARRCDRTDRGDVGYVPGLDLVETPHRAQYVTALPTDRAQDNHSTRTARDSARWAVYIAAARRMPDRQRP